MNWIKHPTILNGESVSLLPLENSHFDELDVLSKDERIWEFNIHNMMDSDILLNSLKSSIVDRSKGTQYPFVIVHKKTNKLIGSTRLMDITQVHRKLEIGSTWLHPDYWGSEINPECKLLLLTHCFEVLQTVRVLLKTDENNIRSRNAIRKIGGQFEGILRNDMIRDNNTLRSSAYFSIIEEEWKDKKVKLTELYTAKKKAVV
jgi:RimJ/RimL family protein N-acetyltransferase